MNRLFTALALTLVTVVGGHAGDTTGAKSSSAALTPTRFLQGHDAKVGAIVAASQGDSLNAEERQDVARLIDAAFDFRELSRRSLGPAWKELTEAERADFVEVYRRIVEERNLDIFVRYHRQGKVTYVGEEIGDDGRAVVHVEVPVKKETKGIDYFLYRARPESGWRIYDLAVDGASTVEANRRAWTRYLARHSFDQLLAQLRKQLVRLTGGS